MNRSFHAFAVLLVSLAGGIIAATWTSTLPTSRHTSHATGSSHSPSKPLFCSCNPDSHARFEKGCARDKQTGEVYGCELERGTNDSTVLGRTAKTAIQSITTGIVAVRDAVAGIPWTDLAVRSKRLEMEIAGVHGRLATAEIERQASQNRTQEQEYAAAELAAARDEQNRSNTGGLKIKERFAPLYRSISADNVSRHSKSFVAVLENISRQWERRSRLWLVESGLHREWDAIEQTEMAEQRLASARMQFEQEEIDRWFENFPPPITRPNRLINPIEPKDDTENSRRMILATAKALETLSGLLHQSAENLARQAEQDVAELHKLKSGIEERR